MSRVPPQPLLFQPLFRKRVWGGRALERIFGKALPPNERIGESWELVDRADAQSVVRQGALRGRTLHELWREERAAIFGENVADAPRVPILAKLLDAHEILSLQVHPPPAVAHEFGGETKTEFWNILAAEPDAELLAGLRDGVSPEGFARGIESGEVAELVHRIKVQAGDSFFVPCGRLHAIGGGNVIVEIQQNSDTTYRVFDWNRAGHGGSPRELHVEEAMRAIDFNDVEPALVRPQGEALIRCRQFAIDRWTLNTPRPALEQPAGALFFCLSGEAEFAGTELRAGEFFLVPAIAAGELLVPKSEATALLRVEFPTR